MSLRDEKMKTEAIESRKKIAHLRQVIMDLRRQLTELEKKVKTASARKPEKKIVYRYKTDDRKDAELAECKRQLEYYKRIALSRPEHYTGKKGKRK